MDEIHSYIGNKKTTVGYGLLLTDMGKDSSISLLAIDHRKQENNYGKASNKNVNRIMTDYWKAYQNFILKINMFKVKRDFYCRGI